MNIDKEIITDDFIGPNDILDKPGDLSSDYGIRGDARIRIELKKEFSLDLITPDIAEQLYRLYSTTCEKMVAGTANTLQADGVIGMVNKLCKSETSKDLDKKEVARYIIKKGNPRE